MKIKTFSKITWIECRAEGPDKQIQFISIINRPGGHISLQVREEHPDSKHDQEITMRIVKADAAYLAKKLAKMARGESPDGN